MKYELTPLNRNVPDEELLSDLKKVAKKLGKESLPRAEYDKHGRFSEGTLRKRFGGWLTALERAGLKKTRIYWTNEQLIDELKRLAALLGKTYVTVDDFRKNSKISNDVTIGRRFGSWTKAIKKAGLDVSPMGHRYTEEDYFNNLLDVWTYYGRQPACGEMSKLPSKIGHHSYAHRFGTWRKALEAFVARMNKDEADLNKDAKEESPAINQSKNVENTDKMLSKEYGLSEDKRGIGLSLRYKILNRDKFKCVKCGASPATDHNCRLHIDHIVPFSKGGKTVLENLQTLCEECNLGKGDRHIE